MDKKNELLTYGYIQYPLFSLQSHVQAEGYLQNEIAHTIEEYYAVVRYYFLQNSVQQLDLYVNVRNSHFSNDPFFKVASVMLNVKRESITPTQVQDYFCYFMSLENSVARGEGFFYLGLACEYMKKISLAVQCFEIAAQTFKVLDFKNKYISASMNVLIHQEASYTLNEIVNKYECLYREVLEDPKQYSAGIIQHNIAERYYVHEKYELAKKHVAMGLQYASKTEVPRDYYYLLILRCQIASAQNLFHEVFAEREECLLSPYKQVQKEIHQLIDAHEQRHQPSSVERPSLDYFLQNTDLTPNEIKFLQCLYEGESDVVRLSEKIFGYIPDEKSLNNRLNNLISRVKKKTNLQIKKNSKIVRIA